MKCPKCETTKLDIETENQNRGIVITVFCTQCDYSGGAFLEEDEITED